MRALLWILLLVTCLMGLAISQPEAYRLLPGDTIQVEVWGHADLGFSKVPLAPDGTIAMPLIGALQAAGLTCAELQERLTEAYCAFVKQPSVLVSLTDGQYANAYVLGEVNNPGPVNLNAPTSVTQALALAGGLSRNAASRWALLTRLGQEAQPLDLSAALRGDPEANVLLRAGDVLLVKTRARVTVSGEVKNPGVYTLDDNESLANALALAGGVTEFGDPSNLELSRGGQTTPLDCTTAGALVLARDQDCLYVPRRRNTVTVLGALTSPGAFQTAPGDRLLDVLALAGGATQYADLAAINLIHRDGQSEQVDLSRHFEEVGASVVLQPGDVVVVPERRNGASVLGAVKEPGLFSWRPGDTLGSLLAMAGGVDISNAELSSCQLLRAGEARLIDLSGYPSAKTETLNIAIEAGDQLLVPIEPQVVSVIGWVKNPGTYTFSAGATAIDALGFAGGFASRNADKGGAYLVRHTEGQVTCLPINLGRIEKGQANEQNLLLQAGDLVVVPEKGGLNLDEIFRAAFGVRNLTEILQ